MRSVEHFTILCVVLCVAAAEPQWTEYRLAGNPDLSATLKLLSECTPADPVFLKLEFENAGGASTVTNASYRIDNCTVFDLVTGKALRWQSLGSGNIHDLFPEGWKVQPINPVLPAGRHTLADHPSGYSLALLGMPAKTGWRIEATAHFELTLSDGRSIHTPEKGVPIRFAWRYPDAQGLEAMQVRLKQMLERPDKLLPHCYALGAMINMPEISSAITCEQALAAVSIRHESFEGRGEVVRLLNDKWSRDEKVFQFYLTALKKRDREALDDLAVHGLSIWDDRFAEVLVSIVEEGIGPPSIHSALFLLGRHPDAWKTDTPARLSAAVLKAYPKLAQTPDQASEREWNDWEYAVTLLAMSRDPARVSLLRPYLENRTVIRDYKFDARVSNPAHVTPLRACDHAYNAIVALLGRPDDAFPGPRFFLNQKRADPAAELAEQDKKIAELIAEFDARKP